MKCVYCSNCGTRLAVTRKALPKYGRIIDLVEPHVCLTEPVEFDLTLIDISVPNVIGEGGNKFVQKLNELENIPHDLRLGSLKSDGYVGDLMDRRKTEDTKGESSSAPRTLLDSVKAMHNTTPVHDMSNKLPTGE